MYYKSFFTINNKNHLIQHEIHSLSSYEFSKCTTGILLVYNNLAIELPPIIEDYGNFYGIPEYTFPYLLNKKKFIEFEKLIIKRKEMPLLPYHKMVNLAKEFYRTKKNDMISLIIINSITAIESMLHKLEKHNPIFMRLKTYRKNEPYGNKIRKVSILNFYLNFYRRKNDRYRPNTIIKIVHIQLCNFILENHLSMHDKSQGFQIINYLNFARIIRNQLIHGGTINFDKDKNTINFKYQNEIKEINYDDLWNAILNFYEAINSYILGQIYQDIDWNIKLDYVKTRIATSVAPSRKGMVLIVPNIDWRETFSHEYEIPEFTIPPEKFPIGIKTNDGKLINLNLDFERGKYEVVDQRITKDGDPEIPFRTFLADISYDQFKEKYDSRDFNLFLTTDSIVYNFRNCPHCDFILAIHRHIEYKNNRCPKCKEEFDLNFFFKDFYLNLYENAKNKEEYNNALNYLDIIIQKDQNDVFIWDNRAFILIQLGDYDMAIINCDRSLELDSNFYNAYYNKACAFSLKNDKLQAVDNLSGAINGDSKYKELAKTDSDFDKIRNSNEFKELIN